MIYRFQKIPNKFPEGFIEKLIIDSKISMEKQRNYISQTALKKSNKFGRLTLSGFEVILNL